MYTVNISLSLFRQLEKLAKGGRFKIGSAFIDQNNGVVTFEVDELVYNLIKDDPEQSIKGAISQMN